VAMLSDEDVERVATAVVRRLLAGRLVVGSGLPRGEDHHAAKLTWADVAAIRARLAAGETQVAIARDYGVSNVSIHHIAAGRTWRELAPTNGREGG
jgi:predicted transcriptional regulator